MCGERVEAASTAVYSLSLSCVCVCGFVCVCVCVCWEIHDLCLYGCQVAQAPTPRSPLHTISQTLGHPRWLTYLLYWDGTVTVVGLVCVCVRVVCVRERDVHTQLSLSPSLSLSLSHTHTHNFSPSIYFPFQKHDVHVCACVVCAGGSRQLGKTIEARFEVRKCACSRRG